MARPKAFDPVLAKQEAMDAFWDRGYSATSVNDLLVEMNLNRGSLYGTFGDKKQLFLAALDEYERQGREKVRELFEAPGPARSAIEKWLDMVAGKCSGDSGRRGCLAAKAAIELVPNDREVAAWMKRFNARNEKMLAEVVSRGQAEGNINASLDPRVLARYLLCSAGGLHMLGTGSPTGKEVQQVVSLILKVLD